MSTTSVVVAAAIAGLGYFYILARMVAYAYFKEKQAYHLFILHELNKEVEDAK